MILFLYLNLGWSIFLIFILFVSLVCLTFRMSSHFFFLSISASSFQLGFLHLFICFILSFYLISYSLFVYLSLCLYIFLFVCISFSSFSTSIFPSMLLRTLAKWLFILSRIKEVRWRLLLAAFSFLLTIKGKTNRRGNGSLVFWFFGFWCRKT